MVIKMSNVASLPQNVTGEGSRRAEREDLDAKIKSRRTNELVIGVCGAVGCNLQDVVSELSDQFNTYSYDVEVVKVSSLIKKLALRDAYYSTIVSDIESIEGSGFFKRYTALQDLGDAIRSNIHVDALAVQAIASISSNRQIKMDASGDTVPSRTVYIVDQLKHPAEVELFRLTYRNAFFLVGVMSPQSARLEYLQTEGLTPVEAQNLVERDRKDNQTHGQQLEKTIHKSDFFLKHSLKNSGNLSKPCKRLVGLVHGQNGITPTRDESGMYAAYSASLKSACLSRQVGAAISNRSGDIVSVGWNDVPASGGGLYSEDSESDQRCVVHGKKCYNDDTKVKLARDIVRILSEYKDESQVSNSSNENLDEKNSSILSKESRKQARLSHSDAEKLSRKILSITALGSIIEYSRAIHAEMEAILNVARGGKISTVGSVMYTTTYPCHNCARHIIASGISRVVYIEPYEKSLAMKLHSDAISNDGASSDKVLFENFEGVSPTRYATLFAFNRPRKDVDGKAVRSINKDASLISHEYLDSYLDVESKVALRGFEDSGDVTP